MNKKSSSAATSTSRHHPQSQPSLLAEASSSALPPSSATSRTFPSATLSTKQPSQQPNNIFEAIENDDWEGLLSLYATTVHDAVYSVELARQTRLMDRRRSGGGGSYGFGYGYGYGYGGSVGSSIGTSATTPSRGSASVSSVAVTASDRFSPRSSLRFNGGSKLPDDANYLDVEREFLGAYHDGAEEGHFRDEKKVLSSFDPSTQSTRSVFQTSHSPTLRELDIIVGTILGSKSRIESTSTSSSSRDDIENEEDARTHSWKVDNEDDDLLPLCHSSSSPSGASSPNPQPHKKTRQKSPINRLSSPSLPGTFSASSFGISTTRNSSSSQVKKSATALDRFLLKSQNNNTTPTTIASSLASMAASSSRSRSTKNSPSSSRPLHSFAAAIAYNHVEKCDEYPPPEPYPSAASRRAQELQKHVEREWERIMWKSASILSNSQPHLSYVVHRSARELRGGKVTEKCHLKSEEDADSNGIDDIKLHNKENHDAEDNKLSNSPPLFEGVIANATPTQSRRDGSGFGTAQHLACLLDSPFALAILIVLGVNVQACHTAFRRLAVHEAACADSPECLRFLMESGRRFERELEEEENELEAESGRCGDEFEAKVASRASFTGFSSRRSSVEEEAAESSDHGPMASSASATIAAATATGFGFLIDEGSESCHASSYSIDGTQVDNNNGSGKKNSGKMKLNLFSGCGWGTGQGADSRRGRGRSPLFPGDGYSKKFYRTFDKIDFSDYSEVPQGLSTSKTKSHHIDSVPFPTALRIIWETIQLLRSGEMTELEAAHHVLDRVSAPLETKKALARQCSNNTSSRSRSFGNGYELSDRSTLNSRTSAVLALYGLTSFVRGGVGVAPNNHLSFYSSQNLSRQDSFTVAHNVDGHGNTPLHWAGFKNSIRAIDVLLSYEVDVNAKAHPSGWTALHDSSYSNSAEAVERLIAAGAEVDARSRSGATPLCFAAQEDSPSAARLLMDAGADPSLRCLGENPVVASSQGQDTGGEEGGTGGGANNGARPGSFHSRFSGYTPLHYCAHYNAAKAARVLLQGSKFHNISGSALLEIPDLNEKLPIHIAVARGSSEVLRELLHGGARVETATYHPPSSPRNRLVAEAFATNVAVKTSPMSIPSNRTSAEERPAIVVTPVSSPVLQSMIPTQPVTSSKPWNCLSQKAIDACRSLIQEVEMHWTPERHALFSPADRLAVKEVLRVGKRLEQQGTGIFLELWPFVLSFCGRGWFETIQDVYMLDIDNADMPKEGGSSESDKMISTSDEDAEFTQFHLEEANTSIV